MAKDVNPPRGMRDFLPAEKLQREQVLARIRGTYRSHGFQEIETPALEDIQKLTSGQGGDNEKLAYRVMKRGAELEAALATGIESELSDLGLRFDLTVPLTRYYATNRKDLPGVFKAIQIGPVWRAERPQKGRYRQFVQCDIDIIGDDSSLAEVDLLVSSLDALAALGLQDAQIRVNHRELLNRNLASIGVAEADRPSAMITIDKLDKIGVEGVVAELRERQGDSVAQKAQSWLETLGSNQPAPDELAFMFETVASRFPGRLRFDPTLVRGMGYYTGAIFEIEHPESGSSIGGGGRYDGMVGRWLGTDVAAVGISLGFERVVDLVDGAKFSSRPNTAVLVLENSTVQTMSNALARQKELQDFGTEVRLENRPKKLNLLLEALSAAGFDKFATVDETTLTFEDLNLREIA
ncbi:MAG: histidine--tRNA ligase [Microbacteriaceae bacterium]